MEKIFPEPTPYEIINNNSYFPSFAFNIVYDLDKQIEELKLKNVYKIKNRSLNVLLFWIIILKILILYI